VANNKNPNEKQPGEKTEGKFHYNPGNLSGKMVKIGEASETKNDEASTRCLGSIHSSPNLGAMLSKCLWGQLGGCQCPATFAWLLFWMLALCLRPLKAKNGRGSIHSAPLRRFLKSVFKTAIDKGCAIL